MLKRTSLNSINKKLKEHSNWNVLDIGCGYTANEYASTVADVQDLSSFYKSKKFIKITDKKLPFKDNEFDFVITSHVIEHVEDFQFFINEIERITKQGYIELPTRLGDNIVFENLTDHIWWFKYDDELNLLLASKKNQILEPFVSVSTAKKLENILRNKKTIAEGAYTVKAIKKLGKKLKLSLPLNDAIYKILYQNKNINNTISELLNRPIIKEN